MKKILFIVLVVLAISAASFYFFGGGSGGKDFKIDYEKLEALAKDHPIGNQLLERIKEREAFLYDEDDSNNSEAYQLIAFDMRQLGDDASAVKAYKKALVLDENNTLALNNMATSYRDIGDFKNAEKAYRKIIEISPGNTPVYISLADVFLAQYPDNEEGLLEFMSAGINVSVDPSDILSYLAVYYRDKGDIDKAIFYFERFLDRNPSNEPVKAELKRLRGN